MTRTMKTTILACGLGLSAGVALACGSGEEPAARSRAGGSEAPTEREAPAAQAAAPAAIPAETQAKAEQIFTSRCVTCHGPEGRGDGPGSAGLQPGPRNFHDASWQASVTDEQIEQAILYGGAAIGKNPAMPANPDLSSQPAVVSALRVKVRGFGSE